MKVLAINGDTAEYGVTARALQECGKVLAQHGIEMETLWLGEADIQGCRGCGKCIKRKKCFFDGAMNEVNSRCDEFDALIAAAPVYYGELSEQIVHFLDRMFQSGENFWRTKPGAAVVSCRKAGGRAALDQLQRYFAVNNMPIVTSQYLNELHGTTAEEAEEDAEGLQTMRMLGENMAWLLKCIESGKANGIPGPDYEESLRPHFIR